MDLAVALSVVAVLAFTMGVLVGKGAKPEIVANPQPLPGAGDDLDAGLALLGSQASPDPGSASSGGVVAAPPDQVDAAPVEDQTLDNGSLAESPASPDPSGDLFPGAVSPGMQFGQPSPQGRGGGFRGGPQDYLPQRLMVLGERLSSVAALSDESARVGAGAGAGTSGGAAGSASAAALAFKPLLADWRGQVESIRGVSKSIDAWGTKLADGQTFVALQDLAGEPSEQHGALELVLSLSEQLSDSAADLSESITALDQRARVAKYEWQVAQAEGSEEYLATSTLGERLFSTQAGFREVLSRSKLAERRLSQARTAVDELSQSLRGVEDDDYSGSATLLAERVVDPVKVKLDTAIQGMTRVRARLESDSLALSRAMEFFDLPQVEGGSARSSTAGLDEPSYEPTRSGRGKVRQDHVGPGPFDGGERFQGPAF